MSTNVTFTGISVKLNENKTNQDSLIEIAKYLNYSEKEISELSSKNYIESLYDRKKNQWRIARDTNGNIGLLYLIDDEYDVFDLSFKISLEKQNIILGKLMDILPKDYINMQADMVNVFAYLYYNGTDSPFTF